MKRGKTMELSQIRYFLETAKTQHITKSAEKLHIAQPALTKSIHKLQEELGVPLFSKKGRNIVLTQYGQYLSAKLQPVIHALDTVQSDLSHMAETEKVTVRLSVLAASTLVTQAIIEYKKKHPNVNFHVLQNPENELYDIEITTNLFYNRKEPEHDRFICTETIFLAVPDTEQYANRTSIRLSEVKEEGFISLFGSKQLRSICDKFCRHAGFEPNIIFESDSPYAVKNMIAANLGIGFWPGFTWGKVNNNHVRLLEIENPACRRDLLITYKDIKTDSTYSKNFYEFFKDYFTKHSNGSADY